MTTAARTALRGGMLTPGTREDRPNSAPVNSAPLSTRRTATACP